MGRNANNEQDAIASCDEYAAIVDGKRVVMGRVVAVPAVTFDEGDKRAIARLAKWLTSAAVWVGER